MPTSDNGEIDPYHHLNCFQQQFNQHASHSTGTSSRRRSSYGSSHYSQQLTTTPIMFKDTCSLIGSQDNLGCTSPSRYECYATTSRPHTRYDENITCCIPPPSPAPQNDRFAIAIPASQHRLIVQQQQQQQRSLSPNSRYRNNIPDRYREISPNPNHFLNNAGQLPASDNFTTYLSSAVHTPVKRYIPTPPLTCTSDVSSTYSDGPTISNPGYHLSLASTQNALTQIGASQTLKPLKSRFSNHHQNQQYRANLKCCSEAAKNASMNAPAALPISSTQTDHYATTPRMRPATLNPKLENSNVTTGATCCAQSQTGNQIQCDFVARLPNSSDYRVINPINMMNQNDQSCLNCRRTAGVHQTTQTTGPISPIPQQPLIPSKALSSNSHHSPLSPQPSTHSVASLQSAGQANVEPNCSSNLMQSQQSEKTITEEDQCNITGMSQPLETNRVEHHQNLHKIQQESTNNRPFIFTYKQTEPSSNLLTSNNSNNIVNKDTNDDNMSIQHQPQQHPTRNTLQQRQQTVSRYSRKQKVKEYIRREFTKFFGVDAVSEEEERIKWFERQNRLAIRCFGQLRDEMDITNSPHHQGRNEQIGYRPDILPAQNAEETERTHYKIERKASVATMVWRGISYLTSRRHSRKQKQWSRSFANAHVKNHDDNDLCDGLSPIQSDETFFDGNAQNACDGTSGNRSIYSSSTSTVRTNGWQTKSSQQEHEIPGARFGNRISSQFLDGIMDNSRRPLINGIKLQRPNDLDDRHDYRPFFTYWINTVHILVLTLTIISYGIVAFGIGLEQKSGQVMVTNLNLQSVTHHELRNIWVGPRSMDLIHLGAKFGGCMRRDIKILDVIAKTKRKERETACCIRNDDSGCVQTSQAECSVGGLWPTQKTISTWKKWSPGPGGRISGSVCGLDPKYCDAPTSIAPYEWPDDITKWPICRKTNSFSHRSRMKDHTAEHMVCEIIGHPCCTGVYGECRITTKEYCDFVNGYFHEEASLCSQVSCMGNVCGMFPFFSTDVPDQFYRLFTSLYLHAGIFHLLVSIIFQHIFLSDLERLLGPLRTAIIYMSSGVAGNLTSSIFVPYRPEVGPLSSLSGVMASFIVLLTLCHWKQLRKPYFALMKLLIIAAFLFGLSTLPWQQNFAGLIGGFLFGGGLTIAIVPFVYITKYNRKSKINLIWTCILLQSLMYATMFIVFYVFPTFLSPLGFSGSHPNDHFNSNGLPGNYDDHSNMHNNQNVFNGVINNYNTGGGIVSSLRSSKLSAAQPLHMNIAHKSYQP